MQLIGIIADTHGLMRPGALLALAGVDLIVHAGDIGQPEVLDALWAVAPVTAIRGNVDTGAWARGLPDTAVVPVGDVRLYVLHNLHDLDADPRAAGFHAVISGHSHRPSIEARQNVLYINPGSAGPRRFRLPTTLALLQVVGYALDARLIELDG